MTNALLASTSTLYSGNYLEYLLPQLKNHFAQCKTIIFIPFAQPNGISYDQYTQKVQQAFLQLDIKVQGLHEFTNPAQALQTAQGIFTGGGNTFLLLHQLYQLNLHAVLQKAIQSGIPYLGTSAGSNLAGVTINNTNDMPIVHPKNLNGLGILPFNLNPHYLDPEPESTHMGETRETRIFEFHKISPIPVLGLREGSWLQIKNNTITLQGPYTARLFCANKPPIEIPTTSDIKQFL